MTWFLVDDNFYDHPKAMQPSLAAIGLWTFAGSWSGRYLTEGRIPKQAIVKFGGTDALARELVNAGLWLDDGDCWLFHDWSRINPTKAQVLDRRRKRSESGRLGGCASGRSRRSKREASAQASAQANGKQVPKQTRSKNEPNTNTNTNTKEREEKKTSPSMGDVESWEPKREHFTTARELSERGYPLVDVTDLGAEFQLSLRAKGLEHYGYKDLDAAFSQWINKRAKSLRDEHQVAGFAPLPDLSAKAKPCHHTWKCRHVLELLHRDEVSADADSLAQHAADLLNQGKSAAQTLVALGLNVDETEAVA